MNLAMRRSLNESFDSGLNENDDEFIGGREIGSTESGKVHFLAYPFRDTIHFSPRRVRTTQRRLLYPDALYHILWMLYILIIKLHKAMMLLTMKQACPALIALRALTSNIF
jgi:hypothetical protein